MAALLSLAEFVRDGATRPFEWGKCDCCLWVSDWIKLRTDRDPAYSFRGAYKSQIGASRYIAGAGGYFPLVTSLMAAASFPETWHPMVGDVGLIDIDLGSGWAMAIRMPNGRWAAKSPFGVAVARFNYMAAWSI